MKGSKYFLLSKYSSSSLIFLELTNIIYVFKESLAPQGKCFAIMAYHILTTIDLLLLAIFLFTLTLNLYLPLVDSPSFQTENYDNDNSY